VYFFVKLSSCYILPAIFITFEVVMLDFRSPFLEVMDSIDAAKKKGHLLYPEKFVAKYQGKPEMKSALLGRTTHPFFEQLPQGQMLYRIKAGVSASDAIEGLLTSNETLIECGTALAIAYHLVVLRMMEKHHGCDAGRKRFDRFFGERDKETPEQRRLVISPFSVVMGTLPYSHLDVHPVQPLSFFIDQSAVKSKELLPEGVNVGTQIMFYGDPNYNRIHPAGVDGAYNCIVTLKQPLKVRSPDIASRELTEEDLYPIHIKAYSKAPSYQSVSMYEPGFLESHELKDLIAKGTQKRNITGFMPLMFKINEARFMQLLTMDIEKMVENLDKYLLETKLQVLQDHLMRNLSNVKSMEEAFKQVAITPAKSQPQKEKPIVSKPAAAAPSTESTEVYAGLKGLAGAFVAAKPAPTAVPKRSIGKH
jgi:hypothetical protein